MAGYVEIDYQGVIYEFPDTMADTDMLGIIQRNAGVQSPGIDTKFPVSEEPTKPTTEAPPVTPAEPVVQPKTKAEIGDIDFQFIQKQEGFETKGYVPRDSTGNILGASGVTIGGGVDLGQWTPDQLIRMGVDQQVVDKLRPYIGLKKDKAYSFLRKHPLSLPRSETEHITDRVKSHIADGVAKQYKKDSQIDWNTIQPEFKTVITSVLFQYGTDRVGERLPKFWNAVTAGKWEKAYEELRSFGDKYQTRRNNEADMWLKGLEREGRTDPTV